MAGNKIRLSQQALANSFANALVPTGEITYAKLTLTTAVMNGDIAANAAIAYSKLNLATSIVNTDIGASAAIAYSKLALATSILNTDVATNAAIAYSKLALSTSLVNADVAANAAIVYSKLSLATSLLNADVATNAAIVESKLAFSTGTDGHNHNGTNSRTISGASELRNAEPVAQPDGTATLFTLATAPAGSLSLFIGGLAARPGSGNDYTHTANATVFTTLRVLSTDELIQCDYSV